LCVFESPFSSKQSQRFIWWIYDARHFIYLFDYYWITLFSNLLLGTFNCSYRFCFSPDTSKTDLRYDDFAAYQPDSLPNSLIPKTKRPEPKSSGRCRFSKLVHQP